RWRSDPVGSACGVPDARGPPAATVATRAPSGALAARGRVRLQRRLTHPGDRRAMLDDAGRRGYQAQRLPAQAPRLARQAIARWRLAAVMAVLGQARLQLLHEGH